MALHLDSSMEVSCWYSLADCSQPRIPGLPGSCPTVPRVAFCLLLVKKGFSMLDIASAGLTRGGRRRTLRAITFPNIPTTCPQRKGGVPERPEGNRATCTGYTKSLKLWRMAPRRESPQSRVWSLPSWRFKGWQSAPRMNVLPPIQKRGKS